VRHESLKGLLRSVLFLALAACIIALTISRISHSSAAGRATAIVANGSFTNGVAALTPGQRAQVRQLLLDGVGTRVSLVRDGALPGQVRASVDTARSFIQERSGLELSSETADKLAEMEQQTENGSSSRISCDDLSDTVLAVVIERFHHSTDAELEEAASQLVNVRTSSSVPQDAGISKGASASKTRADQLPTSSPPDPAGSFVMLRADGRGLMRQTELIQMAKQYRGRMDIPVQMIAIVGIVRPLVRKAFQNRLAILSQGLPDQWGDADSRGLGPVQAFLLSYSVVAGDPLYRSKQGLEQAMKWVEQTNLKADSRFSYPSPAGRLPYGSSGYLFSTPLDLVFDSKDREQRDFVVRRKKT
jgi:hypothetical protein